MYDFETRINRRGTSCAKWDLDKKRTGYSDLLPFWVADMDFRIAPEIMDALENRLRHGIFGYTERPQSLDEALIHWYSKRHDWEIRSSRIAESPGIVPFVHMAVQYFTRPGDGVIIQEPVYYPFRKAIENNRRKVINNPLVQNDDGTWEMNLADLETRIKESGAKLLIFCSPHNPVARVWREEELLALAELCRRYEVLVISDEIHCDLVNPGYRHIPWLTLPGDALPPSISLVSATKTFNLPGLTTAYAITSDSGLSTEIRKMLSALGFGGGSSAPLSYVAAQAAWQHGEPWLQALMEHLAGNDELLRNRLAAEVPEVRASVLEGTYLEWLDTTRLNIPEEVLWNRLMNEGVWPSRGSQFGRAGTGFLRVNIACPAAQLDEGLDMMIRAFKK